MEFCAFLQLPGLGDVRRHLLVPGYRQILVSVLVCMCSDYQLLKPIHVSESRRERLCILRIPRGCHREIGQLWSPMSELR
jgi:hypothetical protein